MDPMFCIVLGTITLYKFWNHESEEAKRKKLLKKKYGKKDAEELISVVIPTINNDK